MTKAALLVLVLVAVTAGPAAAQECGVPHCGPYSEDPGDGCIFPDDPQCDGGSGTELGCYHCFYVPQGPNGEPEYWDCGTLSGMDMNGAPSRCSAGSSYCSMSGMCQVA